jgi:hypothetical protein
MKAVCLEFKLEEVRLFGAGEGIAITTAILRLADKTSYN